MEHHQSNSVSTPHLIVMIGFVFCFCFISHRLSVIGLRPSSSLFTGCVVSLRGDLACFCHAGSGRVGRVWSVREKSLEMLRRGWELNPGHKEDRQWAIPLSYHDHWFCFGLDIMCGAHTVSWIQTQIAAIASPTLYHRAAPLSHPVAQGTNSRFSLFLVPLQN